MPPAVKIELGSPAEESAIAEETESVVSAALFGALAASGALPYPRGAYEATIRAAGLGVELLVFSAAAPSEYASAFAGMRAAGAQTTVIPNWARDERVQARAGGVDGMPEIGR